MADDLGERRLRLLALINGFMVSQAIHAFVVLGLADLLVEGRRRAADLAAETRTDALSLRRLLRALAAAGILDEDGADGFALTPLGEGLSTNAPGSLAGWAELTGSENFWANWGELTESVRTGKTGWRLRLDVDPWEYRSRHPEEGRRFDRAMVSITSAFGDSLAGDYDFSRFRTLVDVGGGRGTLLGQVLRRNPGMKGVLFDLPHVVAGAPELLAKLGVADRCEVVGGSFFESVPTGGDGYLLKSVIHDWYDPEAVKILAGVRRAAPQGAVVLLLERVLAPSNQGLGGKTSDLNMLVNPGGLERTAAEFGSLFEAAGLSLLRVTPTSGPWSVLESAPLPS